MRRCTCPFCIEAELNEIVGANLRDVQEVRLPRMPRLSSMTDPTRTVRTFLLFMMIEVAVVLCALGIAHVAHAQPRQPIPESTCTAVWRANPPGKRYPAKQHCIARVRASNCIHVPRFVPHSVTVKGARADTNQRHVLGWIVSEGLRRRLPRIYILAAIAATTQESTATELEGGEGTSAGPFQLTDAHGSRADRVTVEFSGNWFYDGARKVYRRGMTAGQLAQAVEASGHPTLYNQWVPEARRTLKATAGRCHIR